MEKGPNLFDFTDEEVKKAIAGEADSFKNICEVLTARGAKIKAAIEKSNPGHPTEFYEKAWDLFMDRVLKFFHSPPKEKIENFNAFLGTFLKCSVRDSVDWFSRQKRAKKIEISGDAPLSNGENPKTVFDTISDDEELLSSDNLTNHDMEVVKRNIDGELKRLKPEHRKIIKLWMDGHTEREISELTEVKIGSVGSIISRTIKTLRGRMQSDKNFKKDNLARFGLRKNS